MTEEFESNNETEAESRVGRRSASPRHYNPNTLMMLEGVFNNYSTYSRGYNELQLNFSGFKQMIQDAKLFKNNLTEERLGKIYRKLVERGMENRNDRNGEYDQYGVGRRNNRGSRDTISYKIFRTKAIQLLAKDAYGSGEQECQERIMQDLVTALYKEKDKWISPMMMGLTIVSLFMAICSHLPYGLKVIKYNNSHGNKHRECRYGLWYKCDDKVRMEGTDGVICRKWSWENEPEWFEWRVFYARFFFIASHVLAVGLIYLFRKTSRSVYEDCQDMILNHCRTNVGETVHYFIRMCILILSFVHSVLLLAACALANAAFDMYGVEKVCKAAGDRNLCIPSISWAMYVAWMGLATSLVVMGLAFQQLKKGEEKTNELKTGTPKRGKRGNRGGRDDEERLVGHRRHRNKQRYDNSNESPNETQSEQDESRDESSALDD